QAEGAQEYISAAWRALGMVASRLPEPIAIERQNGRAPISYDAPACFAESLRICTETGIEGERARSLWAWARHEIERGDRAHGTAMWQEARAIFTELGAELEAQRMAELPARKAKTSD